jgi:hypothetical protein
MIAPHRPTRAKISFESALIINSAHHFVEGGTNGEPAQFNFDPELLYIRRAVSRRGPYRSLR